MRKLVFFISVFALFTTTKHYGQSLYKREWGTMIPITDKTVIPFSSHKTMVRSSSFVTEVNSKTENLYLVNASGSEIYEYGVDQPTPKLIYRIPNNEQGSSVIESLKFDSENNLIISGRTITEHLATNGAYSDDLIFGIKKAPSFFSKNKFTRIYSLVYIFS